MSHQEISAVRKAWFPVLPKNRQVLFVLLPVFVLAYVVLVAIYYQKTEDYAIHEARKAALDALLTHKGVHRYITEIARPEIYRLQDKGLLSGDYFSPKIMSFTYAARSVRELINQEREKAGLPVVYFKLGTDNPRNPINQADQTESALLQRMNLGEIKEFREIVEHDGERVLQVAIPIDRSSKGCLKCHGDPKDAPAELIRIYGSERGFFENPNSIRALISIRIPLSQTISEANQMAFLLSWVTLLIMVAIYGLVYFFVVRLDREEQAVLASTRAKSNFLATMSHEIRTPMNGILGMAQMLLMDKIDEAERRDYARTILNSGQTLLILLNDILDFSKIEAGKLELEKSVLDPGQVLHDTANLFRENAAEKALMVEFGWQGAVQRYLADAHRIRQMLSNLTNNAIKFTERGRISLYGKEIGCVDGVATLEFGVVDTGIGISDEKQTLLFQPFSQADSSITRQFGGTGLGLSIVRGLAMKMGGDVGVESRPGQGSHFWFRVQAELVSGQVGGLESSASQEGMTLPNRELVGHVLVVEDNLTNQKVIRALLNKLGLDCCVAADGQIGLEMAMQDPSIDLILMDVQMPVMDGYSATRAIRRWEAERGLPQRPIIALTADAYDEDRQHCIEAGMNDFLAKPLSHDKLTQALQRWLPSAS